MRRACAATVVALAACRGGPLVPARAAAGDGVAVVIHAGRDPAVPGRAYVDDRRWREVPAAGELELGPVAAQLELDSVVVEAVDDPGAVRAASCHVVSASDGLREPAWLWGRRVTATLVTGAEVTGEVIDVGEPVAVIDDGEQRTAVPVGAVRAEAEGEATAHAGPPRPGDRVAAVGPDGEEVFGTFAAIQPERLVLRVAGGGRRALVVGEVVRLAVTGVPAVPTLRCRVESARPGRHLVRTAYASGGIEWRAAHQVALPAAAPGAAVDHVSVTAAYTVGADGLPRAERAHVRLVLGLPSELEPPVTVWDGVATIGGGAVQLAAPPSRRRARLDLVYRGAAPGDGTSARDPSWHDGSTPAVWRELAFERLPGDAPGPVRVRVDDGGGARWIDGDLGPTTADGGGRAVRVPIEVAPELVGFRRKQSGDVGGDLVIDEVVFSVANRGAVARTVVVEEELRGLVRPTVLFARLGTGDGGGAGELLRDRWRAELEVPAGEVVQGQVVLQYRFRRN